MRIAPAMTFLVRRDMTTPFIPAPWAEL
jgi:hypothetical protein